MPHRTLRNCLRCVDTHRLAERENCRECESAPIPLHAKSCGKCGAMFECMKAACWCSRIDLGDATLKSLAQAYVDCLCPECLSEFSVAPRNC